MSEEIIGVYRDLSDAVDTMVFQSPVAYVYNPLAYAREPFERYLSAFGSGKKKVVFMGMNPGPFGMAQTGIPFGDVEMVSGWMGIGGVVNRPSREHPKRPVMGFQCKRREVSGTRLWTWAAERFGSRGDFFSTNFVINYCPLVFMEEGGKNRTPDKLKKSERTELFDHCDAAVRKVVEILRPKWALGVGAFAAERLERALVGEDIAHGRILHPSPASPAANRGWAAAVDRQLAELGI